MNNEETNSKFWAKLAIVLIILAAAIGLTFLCGCASSPRGIKVVSSSASATNLGDINWDEYKIPVFSVMSGPRSTVWVNKDYYNLKKVRCGGCVTNDTSFIAIYSDKSSRHDFIELEFKEKDTTTNSISAVSRFSSSD